MAKRPAVDRFSNVGAGGVVTEPRDMGLENFGVAIDPEVMAYISENLGDCADDVSVLFFDYLRNRTESSIFLNDVLIGQHLRPALADWIRGVLALRVSDDVSGFLDRQKGIGARHARISLPIQELQIGMFWIKRELSRRLVDWASDRRVLADAIMMLDGLFDMAFAAMSHVYVADVVADARNSQALNLQATGIDMALQTEGLRASLFDWHRQVLLLLIAEESQRDRFPAIRRTGFGLWVLHKGELLFPGSTEIKLLERIVTTIDDRFDRLFGTRSAVDRSIYRQLIDDVDAEVTAATAILSSMTDRTLAMEGGRDTLTKLFNRRFLRTVMQREIRLSQAAGDRFGVLLLDIDHFKVINDTFGHDTGDAILKQMAELLIGSVRAGDFVFRYGGEEFLLLVGGMTADILCMIGEKVRLATEREDFRNPLGDPLKVTVSVGLALHDGHPDYQRVIAAADGALYEAKNAGRNRCILNSTPNGPLPPAIRGKVSEWRTAGRDGRA